MRFWWVKYGTWQMQLSFQSYTRYQKQLQRGQITCTQIITKDEYNQLKGIRLTYTVWSVDKYRYCIQFNMIQLCTVAVTFFLMWFLCVCMCYFVILFYHYTVCTVFVPVLTLRLLDQGLSDSPGWAAAGCRLAPSAGWCCWAGRGVSRCRMRDASGCAAVSSSGWRRDWCF